MLCENSVRNKNPKSLQVVQSQSVYVCVCVCDDEYGALAIYITMQVCTFIRMYAL